MDLPLLLSSLKDQLPCHYYSVHLFESNGIYSDYPKEWIDFYVQNHYEKNDYALLESQKSLLPVYWDENIARQLRKKQQRIFKDARDFNIYCGLSMYSVSEKSIVTLASQDKDLSLNSYDYLCGALIFINYLCLISESQTSVSHSDFQCLFNKFNKEREKISKKHYPSLFKALHHIQMGRLYLKKTLFSYEKESAMKDIAKGSILIDQFIDKTFNLIKNK